MECVTNKEILRKMYQKRHLYSKLERDSWNVWIHNEERESDILRTSKTKGSGRDRGVAVVKKTNIAKSYKG